MGDVDILIYQGGSHLEEYSGAKYDVLHNAGFRYFCGTIKETKYSISINDGYMTVDRRTITGYRITKDAKLLKDLFDPSAVVSKDR